MVLAVVLLGAAARAQAPSPELSRSAWARLPLSFEANAGQHDKRVRYYGQGRGFELFLTRDGAVVSLRSPGKGGAAGAVTRMTLGGMSRRVMPRADGKLECESHYLRGADPSRWIRHVPHFARVEYPGVYPGIDLVFHGRPGRQLEYDFALKPGAKVSAIRLRFSGGAQPRLEKDGALVLSFPDGGEVRQPPPYLYQTVNGRRRAVEGGYALLAQGEVGFRVGDYDRRRPLVIDPFLSYSTVLAGDDDVRGLAVAQDGSAWLTGSTGPRDFPSGPPRGDGGSDVLLARLSADGGRLLSLVRLGGGGSGSGVGRAIALDPAGNLYLAGDTSSPDFPTTPGAFQRRAPSAGGERRDGFFAKLDPTGTKLLYASYLGGTGEDAVGSLSVGPGGHAWVVGRTASADFPITGGAYQPSLSAGAGPAASAASHNAFVARIDPSAAKGASLVYATFLGGPGTQARGVAVDTAGQAYVVGDTSGPGFPALHPVQDCAPTGTQGFLARVDADGATLGFSTCLRGDGGSTHARAVAVNGMRGVVVAGDTDATSFPVSANAPQPVLAGGTDAFVSVFHFDEKAGMLTRTYATFVGGSGEESARAIALGPPPTLWLAGDTRSRDFPVTRPGRTHAGGVDTFLTELKADGSPWLFSTLMGGAGDDHALALQVTPLAQAFVGGYSRPATSADGTCVDGEEGAAGAVPLDGFVIKYATFVNLAVSASQQAATLSQGRLQLGFRVRNEGLEPADDVV
ncbi:MAG TPA: SBBP repeat-containing protein, partial [Myxococcaceae bacterium]|nr:SBBP repeat-containing protein [Myxococcaceae bacterium]